MSFLYPAGLLGLAAIPLLLVLFLLRPRFRPKRVSSLYLWKMSLRFHRKKRIDSRTKRWLLLLVRMAMIALASLMIAQPQLRIGGLTYDSIVILDASGSMRIADGEGVSAFERACGEVLSRAEKEHLWSRITILTTNNPAQALVQKGRSVSEVRRAVSSAVCGWGEDHLDGAMAAAQEMLRANPAAKVTLYTDRDDVSADNVEVVRVDGQGAWNACLSEIRMEETAQGMRFDHTVSSTKDVPQLTLALYVDGELMSAQIVACEAEKATDVSWYVAGLPAFEQVRVVADAEDGLSEDNESILLGKQAAQARILLVGEKPFYLEKALEAFDYAQVSVVEEEDMEDQRGYDLYVFNGCLPRELPRDGACLMIDPPAGSVEGGLELGEKTGGSKLLKVDRLEDAKWSPLLQNITLRDAAVMRLREVKELGTYTPIINSQRRPAVLAGRTQEGMLRACILFDLHDSNLPILTDYVVLLNNLLAWAMPEMLAQTRYEVEKAVDIRVLPLCTEIDVENPRGERWTLEAAGESVSLLPDTPGIFTVEQKRAGGRDQKAGFYARMPESESLRREPEEELFLWRPAQKEGVEERDGGVSLFAYLAVGLMALLAIEGMMSRRE